MKDRAARIVARYNRIRRFAYVSVYWNIGLAAYKIVFGFMTGAYFLCVNGLYNLAMGAMKYLAAFAYKKYYARPGDPNYSTCRRRQNDYYRFIGFSLMVASGLFIVYCTRFFFGIRSTDFGIHFAVAVTVMTLIEIVLSLHGAVLTRRDREPMMEAIKLINLSSSLVSMVLVMSAMLSFANVRVSAFMNGILGIFFGTLSAMVGLHMIVHMCRIMNGRAERTFKKRVQKFLRFMGYGKELELICFEDMETHRPKLLLRFQNFDEQAYLSAYKDVEKRFGFELVWAEPVRCGRTSRKRRYSK